MGHLNKFLLTFTAVGIGLLSGWLSIWNLSLETLLWQPVLPFLLAIVSLILLSGFFEPKRVLAMLVAVPFSYVLSICLFVSLSTSMAVGSFAVFVSIYFLFGLKRYKIFGWTTLGICIAGLSLDAYTLFHFHHSSLIDSTSGGFSLEFNIAIITWQVMVLVGVALQLQAESARRKEAASILSSTQDISENS